MRFISKLSLNDLIVARQEESIGAQRRGTVIPLLHCGDRIPNLYVHVRMVLQLEYPLDPSLFSYDGQRPVSSHSPSIFLIYPSTAIPLGVIHHLSGSIQLSSRLVSLMSLRSVINCHSDLASAYQLHHLRLFCACWPKPPSYASLPQYI